jgi:diguanylate cyclase (GGDEF)-like protein
VERSFRFAQLIERSSRKDALDAYELALSGFLEVGRKGEAMVALERVVALDPSIVNYQRQGELAGEIGDRKGASRAFYRAGVLELKIGSDGLARFERSFSLDPSNVDAALAYARALFARGDSARVVPILQPLVSGAGAGSSELRDTYGRALLALNRPLQAEPFIWELFTRDPRQLAELVRLIGLLLDGGEVTRAIALSRKAEAHENKRERRRDYVLALREVAERRNPNMEFLEYLVELYNNASREQDYCSTLMKLYELYYASGNFQKAGESLERAAEVDPYEPGHSQRLEMLRGKIDPNFFSSIAHRFVLVGVTEDESEKPIARNEEQTTILEDFMLQAEIFLQYSMRSKAVERLERVSELFPFEEEKNERLRQLYAAAGFVPQYEGVARPGNHAEASAAGARPMPAVSHALADENAVDNISRVTEITRNIYRQANVKSVLFTTVNEVGRHWNVSRCVAGLCAPGKPPSAALEYCAPKVKQSDVMSMVKLIGSLQGLIEDKTPLIVTNVQQAAELAPSRELLDSLDVQAVLAVPLLDGDQQVGVLILEQCGGPRQWRTQDVIVLKTVADQVVQAFLNARLRSLVKTLAVTEEKSGLLKRSSYLDVLLSEIRRAAQQNSTATVLLFNFGKPAAILKEAGEGALEAIMQQVGMIMASHLRQSDMAVRYDLATIAIILSDTNEKNAFFVVDKMRQVLTALKSPSSEHPLPVTAGIAEAAMQPGFDPVDIVTEVINRAEAALAIAFADGGNRAHSLAPNLESAAVA